MFAPTCLPNSPPPLSAGSLRVCSLILALVLAAAGACHAQPEGDADELRAELAALFPPGQSRAPGMEANLKLAQAVRERFAEGDLERGNLTFSAPVFQPGHLTLNLPGAQQFRLEAMHPALMNPGNFSERSFKTRLVYLGRGSYTDLERLEGQPLDGTIGVLEYDSGAAWMRLLRFGIRGFVFLGVEDTFHRDSVDKVYATEVGVPRYYLAAAEADRLRRLITSPTGQTTAEVENEPSRWSLRVLESPWVLIPGSDPELQQEVVVFTAPLDANSVVPARATGGQSALNLHLLLRLFEQFRKDPPARSTLFVAVNAHTRRYLGERILAWNLLARRADVAKMRNTVARELRIAKLYGANYRKLELAGSDMDPDRLHVVMEMLWQLDEEQSAAREAEHEKRVEERIRQIEELADKGVSFGEVDLEPVPDVEHELDLSEFTETDYREAIEGAIEKLEGQISGVRAALSTDDAAVAGVKEDIGRLQELKKRSYGELRDLAAYAKPVFDDEKLFEQWRTELDVSTGIRLPVKAKLQDEASRVLNRHKLQMMETSGRDDLSEEQKEDLLAPMRERKEDLTKVLVLFNKIDVGVGRSRTYYRDIATNDNQLEILRSYRDRLVSQFGRNMKQKQAELDRDTGNDAIRGALGAWKVQLVVSLGINWHARDIGFCSLNPNVQNTWQREFGLHADRIADAMPGLGASSAPPLVNTLTQEGGQPERYFFLSPHHPATVFQQADQTPALTLQSVHADSGQAFGPNDTIERLDLAACARLSDWLQHYVRALLADPEAISAAGAVTPKVNWNSRLWSSLVRTFKVDQFSAKTTPDQEVPNSLLALYPGATDDDNPLEPIIGGDVINCYSNITDNAGQAVVYGIDMTGTLAPTAYQMDEDFSRVLHTIDKGQIQTSKQMMSNIDRHFSKTLPMVKCAGFPVLDRIDSSMLSSWPITVQEYWPMAASRKAEPRKYGIHGAKSGSPALAPPTRGPAAVYRWQREAGMENESLIILTNQKHGVLNPTEEMPDGAGYQTPEDLGLDFFAVAARDMNTLNRIRLAEMKGVSNQLIEDFLDDGAAALEDMKRAAREYRHNEFIRANYRALGSQAKAYSQLRSINSDMLNAILIYMALMLPFCFFLQKLLFKFTRIEHELLVFLTMFFGLYICFRFIHPAFALAMSAEAIFIGFLLAAVGAFTIWVLHARFKGEMNLLFQNYTGMEAEVSYSTVGQTAMLIGVNNMKRRRIRTSLTTATIVLVTFAMLAFSSVSKKMKPTIIPQGAEAAYSGLFYHWPGGQPMDEPSAEVFENLFSGQGEVLVRRVMVPPAAEGAGGTVSWRLSPEGDVEARHIDIKGAMGLPMEDERFLGPFPMLQGRYFSAPHAREILLTATAAEGMDLNADDIGTVHVRFLGQRLLVAGIVDDERFRLMRDLDPHFKLFPLKKDAGLGAQQQGDAEEGTGDRSTSIGIDTARLVFLPAGLSEKLGAAPFSVSVRFPVGLDAQENRVLWPQLTRLLAATNAKVYIGSPIPFLVGEGDRQSRSRAGTYYVGSSYRTSIGGLSRVLIPLLIAGTIILNTMLGTVYERKHEIEVYNAIGLNPTHIGLFFLGEAFVYSVIGSVSGYLIGQILSIVLKALQVVEGVNINFSSLMVVYAIMLTIALVLLSTLYPAIVATRAAVPSGKRSWSMPDHDGQRMRNVFPFIYQPNLAPGVMYYLLEFFGRFTEQSIGEMIATLEDQQVGEDEEGRPVYRLVYNIALAPFDLGVTQRVTFSARYDSVVQSYRIQMLIERLSGQDTNWATTNKPFMEALRKLLIRWRNLDSTQHRWYVDQGRSLFGLETNG